MHALLLPLICVVVVVASMLIAGEDWQDGSEACSVPDLKECPCSARSAGDHRGDGACVKSSSSAWIWQLGKNSSSPTPTVELRRQPKHAFFRWAVSAILPVISRAEWRPQEASVSMATQAYLLPPGMKAKREVALQWFRIRLFLFQFLQLRMAGRRAVCPKWFVPGGARIVSELWQKIGPDCNLSSPFRVLHGKSRDWLVIFFLLCPCMRFVLSLLHI
jgi:hypothetical protein